MYTSSERNNYLYYKQSTAGERVRNSGGGGDVTWRAGAGLRHLLMQKLFSALVTKTSSVKINFLSSPLSSSSYEPLSSLCGASITYKNTILYSLLFELHKNGYEIKYTNRY